MTSQDAVLHTRCTVITCGGKQLTSSLGARHIWMDRSGGGCGDRRGGGGQRYCVEPCEHRGVRKGRAIEFGLAYRERRS